MTYPQYGDQVLVDSEQCTILGMWPDRILVKVRRNSDDRVFSVHRNSCQPLVAAVQRLMAEAFQEEGL